MMFIFLVLYSLASILYQGFSNFSAHDSQNEGGRDQGPPPYLKVVEA